MVESQTSGERVMTCDKDPRLESNINHEATRVPLHLFFFFYEFHIQELTFNVLADSNVQNSL